jgi:hypothetical protein
MDKRTWDWINVEHSFDVCTFYTTHIYFLYFLKIQSLFFKHIIFDSDNYYLVPYLIFLINQQDKWH